MDRVKNARNGIIFGILNNIINIILPFTTRTVIIYKLGTDYLGLSGLFTSILSVLSLTELGVGAAITCVLYKPIAENDIDYVDAILNLYRKIYRIIGISILALSLILVPLLPKLIEGDYPDNINIYVLFGIYVLNTVCSYFLFGYKRVILTANQRYDIEVNITSISLIAQYVTQIIVLLMFDNYYIYISVMPVMTIMNNLLCDFMVRKKFPQYKCKGNVSKKDKVHILKNVSGAFLSKVGSTVYLSADNIVISAFLGLAILGVYGNYYYIISALIAVYAVIHNTLRPILGNYIVTENLEKNWRCFRAINMVYMLTVIFCCSCCMTLFQDFEYIWAGKDNLLTNNIVIYLVIYFYVVRLSSTLSLYQEAAGILWEGKFIPLIAAGINLTLNIAGVKYFGLTAIIMSSIISSMLVTIPGTIYIMFKNYFTNKRYLKIYLIDNIKLAIEALLIIVLVYLMCLPIKNTKYVVTFFIIKTIVCVIGTILLLGIFNIKNGLLKDFKALIKKEQLGEK